MSRCASCGTSNPGIDFICSHHITAEANWAHANRVFCDLIHRGIEPEPVHLELGMLYDVFGLAEAFQEVS